MELAKKRLELYELGARLEIVNATDIENHFKEKFDMVIFFAALEHMTCRERIRSIQAAYNMTAVNGNIVVVETPNRLWFEDTHTSLANFYHWLPDEVAIDYAKYTKRENFNTSFIEHNESNPVNLYRWGRGVSFHDFEIALGDRRIIESAGSMQQFLKWEDHDFKKYLKQIGPEYVHDGFYEPMLYIALKR